MDTDAIEPMLPPMMDRPRKADSAPTKLTPWHDRWKQPTQEQLLAGLTDQHRKATEELLRLIEAMPRVQKTLIWYGASWHWTIQFNVLDTAGKPLDTFCFVVANPLGPQVCVPLSDEMVDRLPVRRLHKYVRTGIRAAKRAVAIQWAVWTLAASVEVEPLADLLKRKHKMVMETQAGPKTEKQENRKVENKE